MSTLEIVLLALYWLLGSGLYLAVCASKWRFITIGDAIFALGCGWAIGPLLSMYHFSDKIIIWRRKQ